MAHDSAHHLAHRELTVAVLGPGGTGGLLAALLARAGHRVICLAGETTAATLRTTGIQVRSAAFGDFTTPVEADTELREPVDACVVAVKHTSLDAALDRVPPPALGDGLIVPVLNGVEHPASLRARYRPDRVAPAVIRVESTRIAPGVIEHGSPFAELDLTGDGVPRDRLDALAAALTEAGPRTRVLDDESATLWAKMSFLAPFALLTTLHGLPLGDVRSRHREELTALVEETAAVSGASGGPADPAQALARYDAFPATMKSSMQRDAEAGRPLELDAIGGALLRAADRHGVKVPVATRVVRELTDAARTEPTAP
ncbi:2-dehydropantoate 2-reductase [Streptomyces griseorubiginosus]|uniref:ketopantoate reductase family protein n=1 Tax=Streptomyces griseorubiginosus TaxID=67304 RepID=UPI002E816AF6|nr:2-dehydropantoate 2-reductase [Streptomyces griseorubiginosus]WUB47439.1 2-dehydropantoate 2-reductase [Streptomyces griseorubiginosus]WUB55963.1 2-dehydropantoate 2-reductase [Streptomyces griseorubiginosus]